MKEEACISLSLRGRADLGINQLLAGGILLQGILSPWPDVTFLKQKKKKDGVHSSKHKLHRVRSLIKKTG